jgi:hypothetical protein
MRNDRALTTVPSTRNGAAFQGLTQASLGAACVVAFRYSTNPANLGSHKLMLGK